MAISKKTQKFSRMSSNLIIRNATTEDLDGITNVAVSGWPYDAQWNYRFPYREQYPEDHWKFTRIRYKQYLRAAESGESTFKVAEIAHEHSGIRRLAIV